MLTQSPVSIVYVGYDPDKDIWPITNELFIKKWPNCALSTIFVSVEQQNSCPLFVNCLSGGDNAFSARLKAALAVTNSPFVLLLMGDFGLLKKPDTDLLFSYVEFMQKESVDFLQLGSHLVSRLSGKKTTDNRFREIPVGHRYRLSLQPAIWRKDLLRKIVENQINTSWDFEVFFIDDPIGQNISKKARAFFPLKYSFPIVNLLDKGKLSYPAQVLLSQENLSRPANRKLQTRSEYLHTRREDFLYYHAPNWLIKITKKLLGQHGFSKK